jgi:hypothetical protein
MYTESRKANVSQPQLTFFHQPDPMNQAKFSQSQPELFSQSNAGNSATFSQSALNISLLFGG